MFIDIMNKKGKENGMKRLGVGLLIIALLMGSGSGFAVSRPAEPMENELDERLSIFLEYDKAYPGDVKYLSNGNVALQGFDGSMMEISEVDHSGNLVKDHVMYFEVPSSRTSSPMVFSNFLVEDIDGNLYTAVSGGVAEIAYDFSTSAVTSFPDFWNGELWCDVKSKGRTMINTLNGYESMEPVVGGAVIGLIYEEGQSPTDSEMIDDITGATIGIKTGLGYENARIMAADFGDTENELYLLYGTPTADASEWAIVEMNVEWGARNIRDKSQSIDESENWTVEDIIELDETFDNCLLTGLLYDGNGFQISAIGQEENSIIYRVDKDGEVKDSVELPGISGYFDSKGNATIACVLTFNRIASTSGYYKIEWGSSSVGSPRRLIRERSFGGKTIAEFRDGGYGLLQRDDESGAIDYLAPLRTKESDVRLRMPLSDVLMRLGDWTRNLEIFFGEDRISIPMTALAVQDLLAQMPCETDATIEIHLLRGEDGTITVTADLFVVEQVDGMTKLVHRRAIQLP